MQRWTARFHRLRQRSVLSSLQELLRHRVAMSHSVHQRGPVPFIRIIWIRDSLDQDCEDCHVPRSYRRRQWGIVISVMIGLAPASRRALAIASFPASTADIRGVWPDLFFSSFPGGAAQPIGIWSAKSVVSMSAPASRRILTTYL